MHVLQHELNTKLVNAVKMPHQMHYVNEVGVNNLTKEMGSGHQLWHAVGTLVRAVLAVCALPRNVTVINTFDKNICEH